MKSITLANIAMAICLINSPNILAQFNSGSTGADGELLVTNDTTLNLPLDGIFNYTTVTITNAAKLTFNRNVLNTPVYLLATGDIVISGQIIVNGGTAGNPAPTIRGTGGPGGFDGGFGAIQGLPDGDGQGPGGGRFDPNLGYTVAVHGVGTSSNVYGNTLLSPLLGGSGGAARGNGGGGGGGAILIASNTRVSIPAPSNSGNGIYAEGGSGAFAGGGAGGGGSGGAIRIVAPSVEGVGAVVVLGGFGFDSRAGSGRVRIDTTNNASWRTLNLQNAGKWTVGSQMFVFPPNNLKLDILSAAGTSIPAGTNGSVKVTLPLGASTNQIVRVQARGFTNDVSIRVAITPENGLSAAFDSVIQQSSGNPPFVDVPVKLLTDTLCHVHVWTR